MNNSNKITAVYMAMLKKISYFLISAASLLLAGLIIVFPVWFTAVKYPSVYSVSLVLLLIAVLLYTVGIKLYKKEISFKFLIVSLIKLSYYFILICGAGAVVVLYMNSLIFQGSVIMTLLFLISGFIAWFHRKQGI